MKIKKIAIACCLLLPFSSAMAQPWLEDFNSGFPSGWQVYNLDNLTPNSGVSFVNNGWVMRAKQNALNQFIPGDSVLISTSWYTPQGTADDWIITHQFNVTSANAWLKWLERAYDHLSADGYEVRVSTTGSNPADFTHILYSTAAADTAVAFTLRAASLAAFNGQNIRVAFRNNSTNKLLLGIDNVAMQVLNSVDASLNDIVFPAITKSDVPVKAIIRNVGVQVINDVKMVYNVTGTPVTQTFTNLNLAPFDSKEVTFTTNFTGPAGGYNLLVGIQEVNGAPDQDLQNNTLTHNFSIPSKTVPKTCLIEEFTSATCTPCEAVSAWLDPFLISLDANMANAKVNAIKYQMNYPAPGNDPSYNVHAQARYDYYAAFGLPSHYTSGHKDAAHDAPSMQQVITTCSADSAYMDIWGSYTIEQSVVSIDVFVKPYFSIQGNYTVHMAGVEEHYSYTGGTTAQTEYYHVMRNMYPDANGADVSVWYADSAYHYKFQMAYGISNANQSNFNFWANPITSSLVVFVQDNDTRDIIQSKAIRANWPTAVSDIGYAERFAVYPNPANDYLVVSTADTQVKEIKMTAATGQTIKGLKFDKSGNSYRIQTAHLPAGLYFLTLQTDKGIATQRVSIVK